MGTLQDELMNKMNYGKKTGEQIKQGDNTVYSKLQPSCNNRTDQKKSTYSHQNSSVTTAPYNFIKLNKCIVEPPLAKAIATGVKYDEYIKKTGKNSGYFDVEIKNKTILYIGGASNSFFKNGDELCIPGSSLRGCLKNIFKIITNSSFRASKENPDLTNKHLYFRSFASGYKDYKNFYNSRMIKEVPCDDGKIRQKSVADGGFLVKEGDRYYICEAEVKPIPYPFEKEEITDEDGNLKTIRIYHPTMNKIIDWHNAYVDIYTGKMDKKGHYYRFRNPVWNKKHYIPDDVISDYEHDKNRAGLNLLNKKNNGRKKLGKISILNGAARFSWITPCFYVADENVVRHFGSGPFYRIPYLNDIAKQIPDAVNDKVKIDFTDAVFGRKEDWASRVFFEDLYLVGKYSQEESQKESHYHKVLGRPKPTSFQFYLEPNKDGEALNWDQDSCIRGYKMYWHRNIKYWYDDNPKNTKITSEIAPLKKGHIFRGRIRFENLDDIELGALCKLFIIGNSPNICYKLGMGKPIGMGTVELKGTLRVQSDDYYIKLFENDVFAKCEHEEKLEDYAYKFDEYIMDNLKKLNNNSLKLYKERMEELLLIMNSSTMQEKCWRERTRYMDFRRDKKTLNDRIVLPDIKKVLGKDK